jgi:asparagine synthase (glutamine-hydrolysing)
VWFASTFDALRALVDTPSRLDHEALSLYLSWGFVPAPRSICAGVNKLRAGEWLAVRRGGAVRSARLPPVAPLPPLTEDHAAQALRESLSVAARRRLISSDVPVGVFLSGGLDSLAVTAALRDAPGLRTFTVRARDAARDEVDDAARVARALAVEHTVIDPPPDDPDHWRVVLARFGEPFGSTSALAVDAVARAAKEHVTVVLTGDGGDELFGGYDRYRAVHFGVRTGRRLGPLAHPSSRAARAMARVAGIERVEALTEFVDDPWRACKARTIHFWPNEVEAMLLPDVAACVDATAGEALLDDLWNRAGGSRGWTPWLDALSYLPDDLLKKMDRATMAWGVEARSPLLDHDLWAWAATIPREALLSSVSGKRLVRRAYRGVLPDPILKRSKKGFSVPLTVWLRTHLRPAVMDRLHSDDGPLWNLLRRDAVERLVDRFQDGDDLLTYRLWNLLALATWYDARR